MLCHGLVYVGKGNLKFIQEQIAGDRGARADLPVRERGDERVRHPVDAAGAGQQLGPGDLGRSSHTRAVIFPPAIDQPGKPHMAKSPS